MINIVEDEQMFVEELIFTLTLSIYIIVFFVSSSHFILFRYIPLLALT